MLLAANKRKFILSASVAMLLTACSEQAPEEETTQNNQEENVVTEALSFLEENKTKPGVTTTESGLQYKVLLEGTGKAPKATDTVTVHYEGTLTDGRVFDSSYERGEVISFPLNRVIPGWTEGLQLMQEGAKYKFFIPSELAYGSRGAPGSIIGPDSDLIFTVELIRVN